MALQAKYYPFTHICSPLPQTHSSNSLISVRIRIRYSHHPIHSQLETTRTKKKVKPSFFEQIRHKWSLKIPSSREKLPWQEQEREQVQDEQSFGVTETEPDAEDVKSPPVSEPASFALPNRFVSAPWVRGNDSKQTQFDSPPEIITKIEENVDGLLGYSVDNVENSVVKEVTELDNEVVYSEESEIYDVKIDANPIELPTDKQTEITGELNRVDTLGKKQLKGNEEFGVSNGPPWKRDTDRRKRSNTELAERMIPEHELRRLRNVSLRMLERIKVGSAGITQALVDSIHEKWKVDEVVKLKFEEPHSLNMKRTHEILEVSLCKFSIVLEF